MIVDMVTGVGASEKVVASLGLKDGKVVALSGKDVPIVSDLMRHGIMVGRSDSIMPESGKKFLNMLVMLFSGPYLRAHVRSGDN